MVLDRCRRIEESLKNIGRGRSAIARMTRIPYSQEGNAFTDLINHRVSHLRIAYFLIATKSD